MIRKCYFAFRETVAEKKNAVYENGKQNNKHSTANSRQVANALITF